MQLNKKAFLCVQRAAPIPICAVGAAVVKVVPVFVAALEPEDVFGHLRCGSWLLRDKFAGGARKHLMSI
ncbi:hypothetical protein [Thalassospira marina]|uniref:hypothetical protein n=1 Tax=Thalassospira marina TaxID=2048283 RepID=UPI0013FE0F7E|nr:hypothetical protein [Thalassospira marina]